MYMIYSGVITARRNRAKAPLLLSIGSVNQGTATGCVWWCADRVNDLPRRDLSLQRAYLESATLQDPRKKKKKNGAGYKRRAGPAAKEFMGLIKSHIKIWMKKKKTIMEKIKKDILFFPWDERKKKIKINLN